MANDAERTLLNNTRKLADEPLDAATLEALAEARNKALNALPEKTPARTFSWSYGFAAASLVLVLGFFVFILNPDTPEENSEWVADMEFLFDEESILLEDDPEFYLWIEEQGDDALL